MVATTPPPAAPLTGVPAAHAKGLFKVTGTWLASVDPLLQGSHNSPELVNVQGIVIFTPRIPGGSLAYMSESGDKTALALSTRYGRIWQGQLCNINVVDSKDVYLVSNFPNLNLMDSIGLSELIYDVTFEKVSYGGKPVTYSSMPDGSHPPAVLTQGDRNIAPFAFLAPTDPTQTVCLTDPGLKRLPWDVVPPPQAPVY